MALNIKNAEVERLAAEAATLASTSKTEAIRLALEDHVRRLKLQGVGHTGSERVDAVLASIRQQFPNADFGRRLTKEEEEDILGYGPDGF
jgi:antitoxin VapB